MELRITTALDTILRYQTSLKRDFYRAIQMLHSLQDRKTRGNAPQDPKAVKGGVNYNFDSDFAKQTH
jgi:hypothetical protein